MSTTTKLTNLIDTLNDHDLVFLPGAILFLREDITLTQIDDLANFLFNLKETRIENALDEIRRKRFFGEI